MSMLRCQASVWPMMNSEMARPVFRSTLPTPYPSLIAIAPVGLLAAEGESELTRTGLLWLGLGGVVGFALRIVVGCGPGNARRGEVGVAGHRMGEDIVEQLGLSGVQFDEAGEHGE